MTYFDLTVGYELPTKTRIQAGMINLADKQPPIFYQNNVLNANTDVSTYDTLGRQLLHRVDPEVLRRHRAGVPVRAAWL